MTLLLGWAALTAAAVSVLIMCAVGAAGPSAAAAAPRPARPWPPWFFSLHPPAAVVTVALWSALVLGGCATATGLLAVRRGWRPPVRLLLAGAVIATAALVLLPPLGSTDMLGYAVDGRIAALHHNPYVMTPLQLRRAHDPVGVYAPRDWQAESSLYGPLATVTQWAASELGGSSAARTVFWLKVWDGLVFLAVVAALDRLVRADPARRIRAHLLWSVNPLAAWAVLAGGHIDGLGTAFAVLALLALTQPADAGRLRGHLSGTRAIGGGLLLGAATAVKAPFALFGAGPAWAARRSPRTLIASGIGAAAALGLSLVIWGPAAVTSVLGRGGSVARDNVWQVFYRPLGYAGPPRHLAVVAALACVALAALLIWRPPPGARDMPAVWPSLALILAWTFTSSLQRPWYDVMIFPLLVLMAASRLDWVVLAFAAAGAMAYVPGVAGRLAPAWLATAHVKTVTLLVPGARALLGIALVALCVSGAWKPWLPGQREPGTEAGEPRTMRARTHTP